MLIVWRPVVWLGVTDDSFHPLLTANGDNNLARGGLKEARHSVVCQCAVVTSKLEGETGAPQGADELVAFDTQH